MYALLLSVLCSVAIGNLLLLYQRVKDAEILSIFLGNYIVAALFSLYLTLPQSPIINGFDLWFAIFAGLLFLGNFLAYQKNIAINGLSLSIGTMRVSVIIPILVAAVWFSDVFTAYKLIGFVIIILAFASMTDTHQLRNTLFLISLFLITGLTESTLKIYDEYGSGNRNGFLTVLFCSSGVFTYSIMLSKRQVVKWKSVALGFTIGIPNQLSSYFFLRGLQDIPASVAYPLTGACIVICGILCDLIIWKRVFSARQKVALGLLSIGVIIISLGS